MRCYECNSEEFERRSVELATRVGEHTVIDRSVRRPVCASCGAYTSPSKVLEGVELRAAIVAFKDAPKVTGGMLRFARKALSMTQLQLAERLGATAESVSRWERGEREMEQWISPAVIGLLCERVMPPLNDTELRKAS